MAPAVASNPSIKERISNLFSVKSPSLNVKAKQTFRTTSRLLRSFGHEAAMLRCKA